MRKNIQKVIEAFTQGTSAKGDSKGTCSTTGETVYSYAMPIARRTSLGVELAEYDQGPSRTTKSQIRALELTFPKAIRVEAIKRPVYDL